MRLYPLVVALLLFVLSPTWANADAGLAGHWEGEAKDEHGLRYEIEIAIGRDGLASFEYAPRGTAYTCVGSLTLLHRQNESFVYRELLTRGSVNCASRARVNLKPRGDGSLLGFRRTGGGTAWHAELHGFQLMAKPETCAECSEARAQDEIGCRYLAANENRSATADKACHESAATLAAACRMSLHCPAAGR